MRKANLLIIMIFLTFSCNREYSGEDLKGKWRLIESYYHTGGSAQYEIEKDEKIIEFIEGGTVIFYDSYSCDDRTKVINEKGIYSTNGMFIEIESCIGKMSKIYLEFEDSYLKLKPMCVEPCFSKYKKVIDIR